MPASVPAGHLPLHRRASMTANQCRVWQQRSQSSARGSLNQNLSLEHLFSGKSRQGVESSRRLSAAKPGSLALGSRKPGLSGLSALETGGLGTGTASRAHVAHRKIEHRRNGLPRQQIRIGSRPCLVRAISVSVTSPPWRACSSLPSVNRAHRHPLQRHRSRRRAP